MRISRALVIYITLVIYIVLVIYITITPAIYVTLVIYMTVDCGPDIFGLFYVVFVFA